MAKTLSSRENIVEGQYRPAAVWQPATCANKKANDTRVVVCDEVCLNLPVTRPTDGNDGWRAVWFGCQGKAGTRKTRKKLAHNRVEARID